MKIYRKLSSLQKSVYFLLIAIVSASLLAGCSQGKEEVKEKSRIETATENTSKAIVKKIKTPISKVQATQDLGDKRLEEIDKAVKQF